MRGSKGTGMSTRLTRQSTSLLALLLAILPTGLGVFAQSIEHPRRGLVVALSSMNVDTLRVDAVTRKPYLRIFDFSCTDLSSDPDSVYGVSLQFPSGNQVPAVVLGYTAEDGGQCTQWVDLSGSVPSSAIIAGRFRGALYIDPAEFNVLVSGRYVFRLSLEQARARTTARSAIQQAAPALGKSVDTVSVYLDLEKPDLSLTDVTGAKSYPGQLGKWWLSSDSLCVSVQASDAISGAIDSLWLFVQNRKTTSAGGTGTVQSTLCVGGLAEQWYDAFIAVRDTAWGSLPLCDSSLNVPHRGLVDTLRFSVKVDLTAPTVRLASEQRGRWVNSCISPQIQSSSADTLRTNLIYARCTKEADQAASTPFSARFCFPDGEGMYYLQAVGEDSAGNVEPTGVWEDSVGYDVHPPTVAGWPAEELCLNADSLELSLLFLDPRPEGVCRVSGVDTVSLLGKPIDASSWTVQWSAAFEGLDSTSQRVVLKRPTAGDGHWVYTLRMVDVAGNADTTTYWDVKWDQTRPALTLAVPPRARTDPWPVHLQISDALCGIDSVRIDTSYGKDSGSAWLALALGCRVSLDTTLYFPPSPGTARNGVYNFAARVKDCAGNISVTLDSTIFFRSPEIDTLVLADTSSTASRRDHPADPGFTNDSTVLDTLYLTTMPEDPAAYLEFAGSDGVPKITKKWREVKSAIQVDTLNLSDLAVFRDGVVTVLVRLIRPAYSDTTAWDSTKIRVDRDPPKGTLVLLDPQTENNRCFPQPGWTNEPRISVSWEGLSTDVRGIWPAAGRVLSIPGTEGTYNFSAVVHDSAWVDDHAGNVVRVDPAFVYDATTVGSSDQQSWLKDPDTGSREYVDGDTLVAVFRFTAPSADEHMGVKGTWKVACSFGKKQIWTCTDFDSSEANPYVFTVPDSVREDTSKSWQNRFSIPEQWQQNGKLIYLSHAFIDSSGDISHVFVDSVRWVGLKLVASFEDPKAWQCQSARVWSNDLDSILVRVDLTQTTWQEIDTLELDYRWTPKQPDDVFPRPEKPVFTRPMPIDLPVKCAYGRITLRAKDRETGASAVYTDSLRFDSFEPEVTQFKVRDVHSVGLPHEYDAQDGWTNRDTVRVSVHFDDDCSFWPLGYVLTGDWQTTGAECRNDTVWLELLNSGDGEKQLWLAAVDSAGNQSSTRTSAITLDTKPPEWDARQGGTNSPRLFCESIFRSRGDSVWVKVGARDDHALAGFAFVVEKPTWSGDLVTVYRIDESLDSWSCLDSISVPFSTASDTFFVYGLAFDKAGNCSGVDSALVLVTRPPEMTLTAFDACDPKDSVYVNCPVQPCAGGETRDRILIHLTWKRVDSIQVWHGTTRLATLTVPTYTGEMAVDTTITSQCSAAYYDSLVAVAYQLGVVGARATYTFVVDHQAPSVNAVDAVSGPNSEEVVPFVSQPEAWVLVRAADAAPGEIARFWCRAGRSPGAYGLPPDDSTVVGSQAWYHFSFPKDSTGWWYFGAKAWDAANNGSVLTTGRVDYRMGSAAFCYPNPFTPPRERVALSFVSTKDGSATIEIYDAFGYLVWKTTAVVSKGVVDGSGPSGGVTWDGRNLAGDLVASGGYICRIMTPDGRTETVKIGVVR